tara:strand:- start:244 stop:414 length:171 start_codon:yes stop_codon:yes gene_type:complete
MIDTFIVYTLVCWLFSLGYSIERWGEFDITDKIDAIVFTIIAPIILPLRLGKFHKH